jgi:hypothetical protein
MFRTGADVTRISQRIHTRAVTGKDTMEAFDSNVLGLAALSGGLGFAMIWLATRMKVLEQRQEGRCPACGRLRQRGACGCSA